MPGSSLRPRAHSVVRNVQFGKLAVAGVFGATLTPPHASSSLSLPLYSPRLGWGPIVCARLARPWGPSAHFFSVAGPTCGAGEHSECRGPALQRPGLVGTVLAAPPSAPVGAGLGLRHRRWDGMTAGLAQGPAARPAGVWHPWLGLGSERRGSAWLENSLAQFPVAAASRTSAGEQDYSSPLTSYCRKNHPKQTF